MAQQYTRTYGIGLLDDLHNYFPALLYDSGSFLTVQDVLRYIQDGTIRRFNIYDNARSEYRATRLNSALQASSLRRFNSPQDIIRGYTSSQRPAVASPVAEMPRVPLEIPILVPSRPIIERAADFSALFPLLRSLEVLSSSYEDGTSGGNTPEEIIRPGVPENGQGLYEDVIVHASQDIIDQASRLSTLSADLENNCSVCQDRLKQGDSMRTLIGCGHEFHKQCIDPWLLTRSTICPTCRYDIRGVDTTSAPTTTTAPTTTAPPRSNLRHRLVETDDEFINLLFGRTF